MESCLKKKMSRGKRENMGRKENQAKMRKSGQLSVVSRKLLLLRLGSKIYCVEINSKRYKEEMGVQK